MKDERNVAAPVVERQPDAWQRKSKMHGDCWYDLAAHEVNDAIAAGWEVRELYTAPPELAALQSTIAQLQARIAELESGRGEPFGWVDEPYAGWIKDRFSGWATIWNTDGSGNPSRRGASVALYTAPPAPVAVVLPERMTREQALELTDYPPESAMYWYNKALDDVCACLDATAALNERRK